METNAIQYRVALIQRTFSISFFHTPNFENVEATRYVV